ncbi:MAG TPA: hypothetical protein PKW05_13440 [Anaerolineae bacterium]|nr:hypothetical protein [Anaerolineae bacterium]HQJ52771.1 hypothetical protein [Anaerolineae bacterium]
MDKAERAQMYVSYLREDGYALEIDEDGDVMFKFEGGSYFILIDEDDDMFFQIMFPSFWPIESEEEGARVEKAAQLATRITKVAKVYRQRDNVNASVELLCVPPEAFKAVFRRALGSIQAGVSNFRAAMSELDAAAPQPGANGDRH